jgi:acylphosphatase
VTVARRLVIRGRVQGVNFRGGVRSRAEARGLVGWAENREDGSVEVWLQGPPDAVQDVEAQITRDFGAARVDSADGEDAEPRAGLDGFARR